MINESGILNINTKNLIYNYNFFKKLKNNLIVAPTIKANAYGLRLLFNNNKFSLTGSSKGMVGTSSGASRAINRGRASARNAAKLSYKNSK